MKININNILKNKWTEIGDGNIKIELFNNKSKILDKFVTSCVPRTPSFEIYRSEDFEWHREYDYLNNKTSIRILDYEKFKPN